MRIMIYAVALATVSVGSAQAASLQCDGHQVAEGDSVLVVERACGEPTSITRLVDEVGGPVGTAYYYPRGHDPNGRKVLFWMGRVVRIERLD